MLLADFISFVETHLKNKKHVEQLLVRSQAYLKEPTFKTGLALQRNIKQCLNELDVSYAAHLPVKFCVYGDSVVAPHGGGILSGQSSVGGLLGAKASITVQTTIGQITERTVSEVTNLGDVPTIYLKEIFPAVRRMLKNIPNGVIAHMRHFGVLIMVTSDGVMQVSRHDSGYYVAATPWADVYMRPDRSMNLRAWLEMDEILLLALSERALD